MRRADELAYRDFLERGLREHEYLGEAASEQLVYYPTLTRESFHNEGRPTEIIESGKLLADLGEPPLDPEHDRLMLCGNADMLKDMVALLEDRGFRPARHYTGEQGDYAIERAFVDK